MAVGTAEAAKPHQLSSAPNVTRLRSSRNRSRVKLRLFRLLHRITIDDSRATFMEEQTSWCKLVKSAVLGEALSGTRPRRCSRLTSSMSPTWFMNELMWDLASKTQEITGMGRAAAVTVTSQLPEKAGPKIARCYHEDFKESHLALSKAESVPTRIPSRCVPRLEEQDSCGPMTRSINCQTISLVEYWMHDIRLRSGILF